MTAEHADVVVIGSGFGGSVAAFRLADAGESVVVLERGKPYAPGSFPRTPAEMARNFWDPAASLYGMFDVLNFRKLDAIVASGLGGGSLIYANVLLRKDERWFVRDEHLPGGGSETWPVSRADLEPHYDAVEQMLSATPFPFHADGYSDTAKTAAMRDSAAKLGANWSLPPLAVSFASAPGRPPQMSLPIEPVGYGNLHNATRRTCKMCGECNIGCNEGSKNSLDHTYLSAAKAKGADLRTSCEVITIAPRENGGYVVAYAEHGAEQMAPVWSLRRITCDRLVMAAGTFGTVGLLLRNRGSFPGLSPALGHRFSGNGDLLGFMIRANRSLTPSRGPVITSTIRFPDAADGYPGRRGCYVQDAGYPQFMDWLVEAARVDQFGSRAASYLGAKMAGSLRGDQSTRNGAAIGALLGSGALAETSMPLLAMGRELPEGRLVLRRGQIDLDWHPVVSKVYFNQARDHMRRIATAAGAEYWDSPMVKLNRMITVHPVGGAGMGRHPTEGVCDPHSEVFGYPGLYIADGAVMPGSVGPNPSLTIAAMANQMCDRMLEKPHPSKRKPPKKPRLTNPIPLGDRRRQRSGGRAPASLSFSESMVGHLTTGPRYHEFVEAGQRAPSFGLHLDVEIEDIDAFLADSRHQAAVSGWIDCEALGCRLRVVEGTARILVSVGGSRERRMIYRMLAVGPEAEPVTLVGTKEVRSRSPLGLWRDTTRMEVRIYRDTSGLDQIGDTPPTATAQVGLSVLEVARMLGRFRVRGPSRLVAAGRFLAHFVAQLWDVAFGTDLGQPPIISRPAEAEAPSLRRAS